MNQPRPLFSGGKGRGCYKKMIPLSFLIRFVNLKTYLHSSWTVLYQEEQIIHSPFPSFPGKNQNQNQNREMWELERNSKCLYFGGRRSDNSDLNPRFFISPHTKNIPSSLPPPQQKRTHFYEKRKRCKGRERKKVGGLCIFANSSDGLHRDGVEKKG